MKRAVVLLLRQPGIILLVLLHSSLARGELPAEPLGPCSRKTGLVISEILYNPVDNTNHLVLDFIELYNSNPYPEDIGGYQLQGAFYFTFPSDTVIEAKGFVVVGYSARDLRTVYGINENLFETGSSSVLPGSLAALRDAEGSTLLKVPVPDLNINPKLIGADKAGHSLVLARPSYGEQDARAWDLSAVIGGSPGRAESPAADPLNAVMINEVFATGTTNAPDFIELYNHSETLVELSGAYLSDAASTLTKFKIPVGIFLPPHVFFAFDSTELGFSLDADGEGIYFSNTNASRVIDALTFERRAKGISVGRVPDGGAGFYPLASRTPGEKNSAVSVPDVVLNEIMFKPLIGGANEYLELFNQGTNSVALGGWQIAGGVEFTFPTNAVIAPGGYIVVANDLTNVVAHYPDALNSTNAFGNLNGGLHNSGERITLVQAEVETNGTKRSTNYVTIDEVTFGQGGHWSSVEGGSLELIDARSDHRLAYNWAESDDRAKAPWTTIEATGVLERGQVYNNEPINDLQVMMLGAGECLLDKVEVFVAPNGPNLVANPDFENGLSGWIFQGATGYSGLETAEGYQSQKSLHIRAHARGDTGANRIRAALTSPLQPGQTVTIRAKARWLHGWPEVLLRLRGNYLEASGGLAVPLNAGTPGRRNSRTVANAGPAIYGVSHAPVLPAANEPVLVTARLHDPDGISSAVLSYRIDPSTNFYSVIMRDDGTGGDAVQGDGVFSAAIPGQTAGALVAFDLVARDGAALPASSRFPEDAPVRECLVRFGEQPSASAFGTYRVWMTKANLDEWAQREVLSNELLDGTFVYDNCRVVYNAGFRYAGSPNHQDFDSPVGTKPCHYSFDVPGDDLVLGTDSFNKIHAPGNAPFDDPTIQTEQTAYWIARQIGLPWNYKRYVNFYVNGSRRGSLMEDTQVPNGEVLTEHWPADDEGDLFKLQPWYEFDNTVSGRMSFTNIHGCTLNNYTNSSGVKAAKDYRWNYMIRSAETSANGYQNVFGLIDAANTPLNGFYQYNMEHLVDVEQWMRTFAVQHAAGNWDSFGSIAGQNTYAYKGETNLWKLLIWDYEVVLGNSFSDGPMGDPLIKYNSADAGLARIYNFPPFQRAYLRGLKDIAAGPMLDSGVNQVIDAKYNAFLSDGLSVADPIVIKDWIGARGQYLLSQLAPYETSFAIDAPGSFSTSNNLVTITGSAPVEVRTITINNIEYPPTWTSITNWSIQIALQARTNQLALRPLDWRRFPLNAWTQTLTVEYTGPLLAPQDVVVINEIMARPGVPGGGYIEIFNTATNFSFDISGWALRETSRTLPRTNSTSLMPPGTLLTNGQYLVLAENRSIFWDTYGAAIPVAAEIANGLIPGGAVLSLISGGALVDEALYEPVPPRLTSPGSSLQLIDPAQDNRRAANWAASNVPTAGAPNSVRRTLQLFPDLWLNEVAAVGTGLRDSAGDNDPWLEIHNRGTGTVSLAGFYLSASYTNLAQWAFPPGATLAPGKFLVIWADGEPNESGTAEWHTNFRLTPAGGAVVLSRSGSNGAEILDYLNYPAGSTNSSYGVYPEGQSFTRAGSLQPSPGTNNQQRLQISVNELMMRNKNGIRDPADSLRDSWVELYNGGEGDVDLAGYLLAHIGTNDPPWAFPAGSILPAKGFLLVWTDGQASENSLALGRFHTSWQLKSSTDFVELRTPSGEFLSQLGLDSVGNDMAYGRYPDGSPQVYLPLDSATPNAPNQLHRFTLRLPAPPSLHARETLRFRVEVPEAAVPPYVLSFELMGNPPAGANINPSTGDFAWTPSAAQTGTNILSFKVSNNGPPFFTVIGNLPVVVLAPAPELISVMRISSSQVTIQWQCIAGKTYRVQFRNELGPGAWQDLSADLLATGSTLSFNDTTPSPAQRFYRIVQVN